MCYVTNQQLYQLELIKLKLKQKRERDSKLINAGLKLGVSMGREQKKKPGRDHAKTTKKLN